MSVWMEGAAGCPFRRVITPFPSMTPGDTTVTSHPSHLKTERDPGRGKKLEGRHGMKTKPKK